MYFDLEDYHPDITPLGRAISWREGVLLSIIAHLCLIIFVLLFPKLFPEDKAARARLLLAQEQKAEQRDRTQFVFVAPRRDIEARRPPPRREPWDKERGAAAAGPRAAADESAAVLTRQFVRARRSSARDSARACERTGADARSRARRSEEHTSELQSRFGIS